jgi:hypothetical protein
MCQAAYSSLKALSEDMPSSPANLVGNATLTRSDLIKFGN